MTKFKVVFVLALAHSGSTLLGRILDRHSGVICVGELLRIEDAINKAYPCSCGKLVEQCEFWRDHLPLIENTVGLHYMRFTPAVYEAISSRNDGRIVVDLSKTRVIRLMYGLFSRRRKNFKDAGFILLIRDPRGVSASALRSSDKPLGVFLNKYFKWMKRFQKFAVNESERLLVVNYEDLCENPEHVTKKLCDFMGLYFEPAMLNPSEKQHHFVHSSTSNYMKNGHQLQIDERWRSELRPSDIAHIESFIGRLPLLKAIYSKPRHP